MLHDFYKDEDGDIDIWRVDEGYHNGPECIRCGEIACHHCAPWVYTEECPSQQLDILERNG